MGASAKILRLAALLAVAYPHDADAEEKTVCTIRVNSPDDGETFRRSLAADKFQFVELVERGRPDWLQDAERGGAQKRVCRNCAQSRSFGALAGRALDDLARDRAVRDRYLDFARDPDQPDVRARMIALAHGLGWLTWTSFARSTGATR